MAVQGQAEGSEAPMATGEKPREDAATSSVEAKSSSPVAESSTQAVVTSSKKASASQAAARETPGQSTAAPHSAASPFNGLEGQVGLGIDLVDIRRMARILQRTPRFATRVYSADEQAYCNSTSRPEAHYATRFAAKEAVLKALGTGFAQGVDPRDIEVRRNVKGRPFVHLSGKAKEIALQQNVRSMPISLSFTHEEAVACALAITQDSLDAMNSRVDVAKEMTKRFKEARAMLDDLDDVQKADALDSTQQPAN